jgi:peptidoglycan/xylan/chitin deacetylase (PgdA/CDA1 family)
LYRPPLVLGYHGIADVDPRHDPVRLFVSPDRLRGQIERLRSRGYRFVTASDFAARLSNRAELRATCALTFDDGVEDSLPAVLEALQVPGTIYVCPGLTGKAYPWASEECGIRLMSAERVGELARSPLIEIGSHTNEHTVLEDAGFEDAYEEMTSSKSALEEMIGAPVLSFAYPRCRYSDACPGAARKAGYTNAVTCGPRGSWDPHELRRETIHTPDGRVTFALKARGAYYGLKGLPPARLARWVTRPIRHRAERSGKGG